MIQLRKIRPNPKKGVDETWESGFEPPITVPSLAKLFADPLSLVDKIPGPERWNIFYTLGATSGDAKRDWYGQEVVPFDIDGVVDADGNCDEAAYLDAIFDVLQVERTKCVAVASGNGLHILVAPPEPIKDKEFFVRQRKPYENICSDIEKALRAKGLAFKEVDVSSFAPNRILRMPGTTNRKAGKPDRAARVILGELAPQPFALMPPAAGKPLKDKDHVSERRLAYFKIDTPAVEAGCAFLKHAREAPADINEPQWYALLSIVGRLEDGRAKVHAYSQGHARYSVRDTDRKLDQALTASGPRTCDNIDHVWGGCAACPFNGKVTSPVSIRGETFIATEASGFHLLGKSGPVPEFEDLRRYLKREHPYRVDRKSGMVFVWAGTQYEQWSVVELKNFADRAFSPKPSARTASEFIEWVQRDNLVDHTWFQASRRGFINFANGVLELATGALHEHSPERGFLYTLPYAYDASAACPTFDKFMDDVCCGDPEKKATLLEFGGYSICDDSYWLQKILILLGEGANGKSTFLNVMSQLAGDDNVAALSLSALNSETSRSHLVGKLLNIADEMPSGTRQDTETMKKLLGGTMTVRKLYFDGMRVYNTAKFIFAGNALPEVSDTSEGWFRRLAIVPFQAHFTAETSDHTLGAKLKAELPGIFNRVLEAYKTLKARGKLLESAAGHEEKAVYRADTDRVGTWIKENLYWNGRVDAEAPKIAVTEVYSAYSSYTRASSEKAVPCFHFTRHLRKTVDRFAERYQRDKARGPTRDKHVLFGVTFRSNRQQPDETPEPREPF